MLFPGLTGTGARPAPLAPRVPSPPLPLPGPGPGTGAGQRPGSARRAGAQAGPQAVPPRAGAGRYRRPGWRAAWRAAWRPVLFSLCLGACLGMALPAAAQSGDIGERRKPLGELNFRPGTETLALAPRRQMVERIALLSRILKRRPDARLVIESDPSVPEALHARRMTTLRAALRDRVPAPRLGIEAADPQDLPRRRALPFPEMPAVWLHTDRPGNFRCPWWVAVQFPDTAGGAQVLVGLSDRSRLVLPAGIGFRFRFQGTGGTAGRIYLRPEGQDGYVPFDPRDALREPGLLALQTVLRDMTGDRQDKLAQAKPEARDIGDEMLHVGAAKVLECRVLVERF